MSSEVEICNLALGHLGDEASVSSIDPPEGSAQADHCSRFYPIARNTVLEQHAWNFATKRLALTELVVADAEMPTTWAFSYGYPNNCLRVLSILPPDAPDDTDSDKYTIETLQDESRVIYTNTEDAIIRYTSLVTDTSRFSPLVVNAISRLLASYLAGPVIKGMEGMKVAAAQFKWYQSDLGLAKEADANGNKKMDRYKDFTPSSVAARA